MIETKPGERKSRIVRGRPAPRAALMAISEREIVLNSRMFSVFCKIAVARLLILIRFQGETNYVTMVAWQDLVVRI